MDAFEYLLKQPHPAIRSFEKYMEGRREKTKGQPDYSVLVESYPLLPGQFLYITDYVLNKKSVQRD